MNNEKQQIVSIRINRDIWKEARKYAIDKRIAFGSLVETAIIRTMQGRVHSSFEAKNLFKELEELDKKTFRKWREYQSFKKNWLMINKT